MKSRIAEKDGNTTDLRLAFVISFRESPKSFPGCFWLAGQPREPNYGFLSQSPWSLLLWPCLPASFWHQVGCTYQVLDPAAERAVKEDLTLGLWARWTRTLDGVLNGSVTLSAIYRWSVEGRYCWWSLIYLAFDLLQKFTEAGPLPSLTRRTYMTSFFNYTWRIEVSWHRK